MIYGNRYSTPSRKSTHALAKLQYLLRVIIKHCEREEVRLVATTSSGMQQTTIQNVRVLQLQFHKLLITSASPGPCSSGPLFIPTCNIGSRTLIDLYTQCPRACKALLRILQLLLQLQSYKAIAKQISNPIIITMLINSVSEQPGIY